MKNMKKQLLLQQMGNAHVYSEYKTKWVKKRNILNSELQLII